MNPFQKNPKHASVLAERYLVFVTCSFLLETMGFQCFLKPNKFTGYWYKWRLPPSAAGSGAAGPGSRRVLLFTQAGGPLSVVRWTQTGQEGLLLSSPHPPLIWQMHCWPFHKNLPGLGVSVLAL